MSEHVSSERMGEALDGLLASAERQALERHVDGCAACRNEYARLSEVVQAVRGLPRSAAVPEDFWARISARLPDRAGHAEAAGGTGANRDPEAARGTWTTGETVDTASDVRVYRLPTRGTTIRRISLSIPQLAAAAGLVALISAGVVWLSTGGGHLPDEAVTAAGVPARGALAARAVSAEGDRYANLMQELESILDAGRDILAPETMASIEESLATLDAAIADIQTALAADPASDLLQRMLAGHQRTRLGVLRRAASAVQAQT
jgi:anti-sigma factor RsiW